MKVIYLLGCGRSGTTLTNLLLDNQAQVCGVGEIYHLHSRGWVPDGNARCACGSLTRECEFWSDVRRVWLEDVGPTGIERYIRHQERFERLGPLYWPKALWVFREPFLSSARFTDYMRMTTSLYAALGRVSMAEVVVDSSKNPLRAFALMLWARRAPDIDLFLIHVVRDLRGVTWSKLASRRRKAYRGVTVPRFFYSRTAAYWTLKNLLCEALTAVHGKRRSLRIRYEDLAEKPLETLGEIGAITSLDLSEVGRAAASSQPISSGHVVYGNRLRMHDEIVVRPDHKWRSRFPERERRRIWRLFGWSARRYGYREDG